MKITATAICAAHLRSIHLLLLTLFAVDWGMAAARKFPSRFLFGVASSAYQIEGGHDVNGKGVNIWDYHIKQNPSIVRDGSNAHIACDSYHKVQEDLKLVQDLGVDFYRFSISWSRLLPNGYSNKINPDAIRYYNELIDGLVARNIKPMVTMYHWDLPKILQDVGGLTNPLVADYFQDYARILFQNFGDRVKYWITFNVNPLGYEDGLVPPFLNQPGIGGYQFAHVVTLAHAKVYHLYSDEFRAEQNGKIGLTIDGRWYEAGNPEDEDAAERVRELNIGLYANPIFGKHGDYPEVVKTRVEAQSKKQNFVRSRLPQFTKEQVAYIKGASDFLGLNIFTTYLVRDYEDKLGQPSAENDLGFRLYQDESWTGTKSDWLKVTPWGLRKVLKWIKDKYDNPEVIITENGMSDDGRLDDVARIEYYKSYLSSLLEATHEDGVNVQGYAAWSLLDNFEWTSGYTERFGLYSVDFSDPDRKRTPKASSRWYKSLIKNRSIPGVDNINIEL